MRGRPPPQVIQWPPQNEYVYQSPAHLNRQPPPQLPQTHHNVDFSPKSHHCLHGLDSMPETHMREVQWLSYDQATSGMAASRGTTFTPAAPITHTSHVPHIDCGNTHHPSDRLNIRFPASPQYLDPILNTSSIPLLTSSKPTCKAEPNTERLPDNKGNLERMRHERELIFEKTAIELDQARRDNTPSAPSNKAWESAWDVMRQSMARM